MKHNTRQLTIVTRINKEHGFNGERFLFITKLQDDKFETVARMNLQLKENEFVPLDEDAFSEFECAQNDKIDTILMVVGMTKEEIMKASFEMFKLHEELEFIETTYSSIPTPIITKITTNKS